MITINKDDSFSSFSKKIFYIKKGLFGVVNCTLDYGRYKREAIIVFVKIPFLRPTFFFYSGIKTIFTFKIFKTNAFVIDGGHDIWLLFDIRRLVKIILIDKKLNGDEKKVNTMFLKEI